MRLWGKGWIIFVSAVALVTQCAAQTIPRISGKPDFNGIWETNNTANWDLQTHQARPMVGQRGVTPNSVVLAAPVVALGSLGWVPGGLGAGHRGHAATWPPRHRSGKGPER